MAWESGIAGRCEVAEDGYEEQIIIPKEQRDLAAEEGIGTENKQKLAVRILNLNTGESYTGRLACPPSASPSGEAGGPLPEITRPACHCETRPPHTHTCFMCESVAGR